MLAVMAIAAALVAPSRADAFVGESLVVDAGGHLSKAAETVVKGPKFLPETITRAASVGGAGEATGAALSFRPMFLPALAPIAAFGVGAGIGSEVCHVLGIEGCWFYGSDDADAVGGGSSGWEWQYYEDASVTPLGETVPAGTWRYTSEATGLFRALYSLDHECENLSAIAVPDGAEALVRGRIGSSACRVEGETYPEETEVAYRWLMGNRVIEYHATDNPEIPNVEKTATPYWEQELGKRLRDAAQGSPAASVGQRIASEIPGSGVEDPYSASEQVPDCVGSLWVACKTQLEELDLVPQKTVLDWQSAVVELEPGTVTTIQPAAGSEVETETAVQVQVNPPAEGMPVVVPEPEEGETYSDYVAGLDERLQPGRVDLPAEFVDPGLGPNAVIGLDPAPGTRLDPSSSHEVDVRTNPATAPAPSGQPWSAPTVPAIDPTPLTSVTIGCSTFPFGIFCWIAEGLGDWTSGAGQCPQLSVPIGGSQLEYDGCDFEPAMEIIRPVIVVLSAMSVAWLFAASALGLGGGQED